MDAKRLRFVLEELRFTADFPPDVLDSLAVESNLQNVSAGSYLFREGSKNDNLYLVHSGRLAMEIRVPGRGVVRILTLGPGEMIGWSALLDQGKMTASVRAMENSEVVFAPAGKLLELSDANREFGYHLMLRMAKALSKRLTATRLQLLDLFADAPPAIRASAGEGEK